MKFAALVEVDSDEQSTFEKYKVAVYNSHMRAVPRALQPVLLEADRSFPAVVVTGPRRSGKTTLLRRLFPRASYVLLEDPDVQARARADPRTLLDELRLPAVLDEIQNVPELLAYIRSRIDQEPRRMDLYLRDTWQRRS